MAVVAGLLVATGLAAGIPLSAEIIEQVLVKVNGEIVSKTDFEQRQISTLRGRPEFANAKPKQPRTAESHWRNHSEPDPRSRGRIAADPTWPRAQLRAG